jgi:glycyl-tRNA synthetase alpha chain
LGSTLPPSFQQIILDLQQFWADYGCVILQPYDIEMGAGTSHPATLLQALGEHPWKVAYVQPSRRPSDGRYGENPNRMQKYYQFQVLIKPAPVNSQDIYLKSLEFLGFDIDKHDIRFIEDDWENPSLGASGVGWEISCDGMEISQFTYFQQVGTLDCMVVPVEITYGLERLALFLQATETVLELNWNGKTGADSLTYKDVCLRQEVEFSKYNFELANTDLLWSQFSEAETECLRLIKEGVVLPAYDYCLKANHLFNLLNARGVIGTAQRAHFIARVRSLAKNCCEAWLK